MRRSLVALAAVLTILGMPALATANLITNPSFESGLTGWTMRGNHERSSLENSGFASSRSLHVRATSRGDIWRLGTADMSVENADSRWVNHSRDSIRPELEKTLSAARKYRDSVG